VSTSFEARSSGITLTIPSALTRAAPFNDRISSRVGISADTGNGHDVFVGKTGANLNYGLEYATNDITGSSNVFVHTYSSVAAASNQTVLLVVKLEFNFGGPENFRLYVNPTPGNPEPVTPDAVITNDIGTQNGLAMNMGNGAVSRTATTK